MFELDKSEWKELITNCDNLNQYKYSPALPYAFTEQGVSMISSILKRKKALHINISIMWILVLV
jgi:hypothetical protein